MRRVALAVALALFAAPLRGADDEERTLAVNGVTRHYLLHVPAGLRERKAPAPLVLAFHGGGGRASGMEKLTHASVAATMGEPLVPTCKPARPVSVMFVMGDEDPLVPIGGGTVAWTRGSCVSLDAAVRFWTEKNGISAPRTVEEVPDRDPKDGTRTRRESYRGGRECAVVEKWIVAGGGHTWPSGFQYLPKLLVGPTSRDFDATEEILRFFEAHGRRAASAAVRSFPRPP